MRSCLFGRKLKPGISCNKSKHKGLRLTRQKSLFMVMACFLGLIVATVIAIGPSFKIKSYAAEQDGGSEVGSVDADVCNRMALKIEDAVCLQDMNNAIKATMETGVEYELVDIRDTKTYRVAKLADGNVWLLDNLRIGGDEEMLLTSLDTNTNPDVDDGEFVLPAAGDWVDSYTEPAIDTTDAEVMLGGDADKVQGGYYNYCAASAGTYCAEANESEGDAEYDICPAGWRMPTGGSGGEYQVLSDLLGSDFIDVMHLPLSGRFYDGASGSIDQDGYFWSSTYRDGVRMYYLNRSNQTINTTGSYRRDRGYSMRCVALSREAPEDDEEEEQIPDTEDEEQVPVVPDTGFATMSDESYGVDDRLLVGAVVGMVVSLTFGLVILKKYQKVGTENYTEEV